MELNFSNEPRNEGRNQEAEVRKIQGYFTQCNINETRKHACSMVCCGRKCPHPNQYRSSYAHPDHEDYAVEPPEKWYFFFCCHYLLFLMEQQGIYGLTPRSTQSRQPGKFVEGEELELATLRY